MNGFVTVTVWQWAPPGNNYTMTQWQVSWWHVTTAQSTLYSRPHPHLALSSHLECCARGDNYDMAPALGGVAQSVIWGTLSLSFAASFHCLWTAVSCLVSPAAWRPNTLASPPSAPPSLVSPSVRGGGQMKHQFIPRRRWRSLTSLTSLLATIINVDNHKIYHDKCPPDGNKNMINNTPSLRHCLL